MQLIPGDLLSACPQRQFHTLPGLLDSGAVLSKSYPRPNTSLPSRKAVCTIFMIIFGMARPGREPMTYRMRGRHAKHYAIPMRYMDSLKNKSAKWHCGRHTLICKKNSN